MADRIGVIGEGFNYDEISNIVEKEFQNVRRSSTLQDLKSLPRIFKSKTGIWKNKQTRFVTILGAAGEEDIPEPKLKVITGPYTPATTFFPRTIRAFFWRFTCFTFRWKTTTVSTLDLHIIRYTTPSLSIILSSVFH